MAAWFCLIAAGILEIVWSVGLKYTDGFSKLLPSIITAAAIAGSMFLLSKAAQTIPVGTAYCVWVGIGSVGAVIAGAILFDEALTAMRILCIAMLVAGIVGLKLTSD